MNQREEAEKVLMAMPNNTWLLMPKVQKGHILDAMIEFAGRKDEKKVKCNVCGSQDIRNVDTISGIVHVCNDCYIKTSGNLKPTL